MNETNDLLEGVADQLRELRLQAGLKGQQLADQHGWQQSKVSKIETGKQAPTDDDIRKWVSSCGAESFVADELIAMIAEIQAGHRDWKRRLRRGPAAVQAGYNQLVSQSKLICHFETVYVPGLLQTPEYAQFILTEGAQIAEADPKAREIAAAVVTRMERQRLLYDGSKRFEFLLSEPVLHWLLCPPAVMRGQLDRLQTVVGLSSIRFGILPLGRQLRTTPQNSFQLYDDLAIVETFVGEWRHNEQDSAVYRRTLDRLWEDALTGDAAREAIVRAARQLPPD